MGDFLKSPLLLLAGFCDGYIHAQLPDVSSMRFLGSFVRCMLANDIFFSSDVSHTMKCCLFDVFLWCSECIVSVR